MFSMSFQILPDPKRIACSYPDLLKGANPRSSASARSVRKYAAKQGIAKEEALKKGMEEKCKVFVESEAEVYTKA